MSEVPVAPTTAQLVLAFADALAPFAGTYGIAGDAVIHAGLIFLTQLQANKPASGVYTMADLEASAAAATSTLTTLQADLAAQQAAAALGFQPLQNPGVAQNPLVNAQGIQSVGTKPV